RMQTTSACAVGSPDWTRRLCPRAITLPLASASTDPIGMPPSARPSLASAIASRSNCLSSIGAAPTLHLVSAEVVVVEAFQPLAHLFAVALVGDRGCQLGVLQHSLFNEYRAIHSQRQRQCVRRPRIHANHAPFALHPYHCEEGVIAQLTHHHLVHASIQ